MKSNALEVVKVEEDQGSLVLEGSRASEDDFTDEELRIAVCRVLGIDEDEPPSLPDELARRVRLWPAATMTLVRSAIAEIRDADQIRQLLGLAGRLVAVGVLPQEPIEDDSVLQPAS